MKWLLLVIVLFLSACSVKNDPGYIQESLLQQCTIETPIPDSGSGEDVYKALNEWQEVYNECRASKTALIEAVRGSKDVK
ncbi:TPA: hypothetical protein QHR34_004100 [Raoultella ornithinolytica]|nr:hypothetical protein [Raoultella ornithinolytica]HDT1249929.1 hypothetical protein [Raoultella ornithinolytica]